MASSLMANAPMSQEGDPIETISAAQRQKLQQQQSVLLNSVKQQLADLTKAQTRSNTSPEERAEQEKKRREMVKLLAKIENRINAENARPRKRYLSPAVREVSYARYYDAMRQAIEARGTAYFPEKGGKKLYGSLTMVITVDNRGVVLDAEVAQASGTPDLDRRAQEIARKSGPFGAFTAEMRKTVDQLVVVSRFTFTKEATLQTKAMVPP
jgi:protein TonB